MEQALGQRQEVVTVGGVAPEQGLLEAAGPMVDLSGDLPQQEGL